jgi:drug/metabolite transporter superfamily protein YnfA
MIVAESSGARPVPPPFPLESRFRLQAILLLVWFLVWILVQSLMTWAGLGTKAQVGLFFAGLVASLGGAFLKYRERWVRLLTSTVFAVTQVVSLGLAVLLGTLIPQGGSLEFYRQAFGPVLAAGLRRMQLNDVFGSLWFLALLALLSVSMLAVTWKRRPYSPARLGFLLVHIAPTFIFLGGLWGLLLGVRAQGELKVGQGSYTFQRTRGPEAGRPYVLPGFQVKLERFEVRRRESELKLWGFVDKGGVGNRLALPVVSPLAEGQKGELRDGLTFEIERLVPEAVAFGLEPGRMPIPPVFSADPDIMLVMLGVGRPQPLMGVLRAFAPEESRKEEPSGRFAVLFRERLDAGLLAELKPRPPQAEHLVATLGAQTRRAPAKVGEVLSLTQGSLRILALYPDFQVIRDKAGNPMPATRSGEPKDPWLQAEFTAPGSAPRRVLLSARQPEYTDRLNAPNLPPGLGLRYLREGEETQRRFVVFTREGRRVALVESGAVVRESTWNLDLPFVVEPGLSATPVGLFDSFLPPPAQSAIPSHAALRVKVTDSRTGAAERTWLQAGGGEQVLMGGRISLTCGQAPPEPRDFRSTLVIADPQGRELARKVVAVNDPLLFEGLAFLQSPRSALAPDSSAILVVDQPGAWIAWVGYALLLLGTPWMFYLKPWLKRRAEGKGGKP